jgi:hypothetical protein
MRMWKSCITCCVVGRRRGSDLGKGNNMNENEMSDGDNQSVCKSKIYKEVSFDGLKETE